MEQHFPVVLFVMLNKVVLTFESVDGLQKCHHSDESYLSSTFLCCCSFSNVEISRNLDDEFRKVE